MSDSTLAILERTHTELCEREAKLAAFGRELTVTTQARKDLERTLAKLGSERTSPAAAEPRQIPARTGGNQTPGSSPRERFTERVVDVLLEHPGGHTSLAIAEWLGREHDRYLDSILTNAVLKGVLSEDEGVYRVPS